MNTTKSARISLAVFSLAMLTTIYLLQHFNYLALFTKASDQHPNYQFAFNRIVRFLLNDSFAILLIYTLFNKKSYVQIAFMVQLFGLFIIMPIYLYFKLTLEGPTEISSPLLSYIHRIVIHPFLILLLIPAFLFINNNKKA